MRLSSLLSSVPGELLKDRPEADPVIRGVVYDSRSVAAGDLFVALRGANFDGHAYLEQALDLGAVALMVEALPAGFDTRGRSIVTVGDSRRALAPVARSFYGDPAAELALVGVTGTNGKTSVTYLLESILARADHRVGLIGTVEIRHPGERQVSTNTTPESLDLQRSLRSMRTNDVDTVVIEVSSHGLELGRVAGCRFAVAAFTNLTQDHLDFHETMEAYRDAKTLLFRDHLADGAHAVVNVDDPSGDAFVQAASEVGASVLRVSRDAASGAEVVLESADVRMDGTTAGIRLPDGSLDLELPLVGDFNVENALVACAAAWAMGTRHEAIAAGVAACPQVPGRVERIAGDEDAPTVLVDYAHTPDALEKLVRTLRPLSRGRLITVFGCGGDRDRRKRPLMAEAAARHSDLVIATSDNPRTEDPEQILADVVKGLAGSERVAPDQLDASERGFSVLVDRREAIALAIGIARSEDTVVIAGKGHEDYQIVGRDKLPFSDTDEARRALQRRAEG